MQIAADVLLGQELLPRDDHGDLLEVGVVRAAGGEGGPQLGVVAALGAAAQPHAEPRVEAEDAAVQQLEIGRWRRRGVVRAAVEVSARAGQPGGELGGLAARRVVGEFGSVDEDADVLQVEDDAVEDVRDRVRSAGVEPQLGGVLVDLEGRLDHDVAEVEGPDRRRVDRHQRERRSVVGAGEIDLALGVGEGRADAVADDACDRPGWPPGRRDSPSRRSRAGCGRRRLRRPSISPPRPACRSPPSAGPASRR